MTIICRKRDKEDFKNCLLEFIQTEATDISVDIQDKEEYSSTVEMISKVRDKNKEYYFIISGDVLMRPTFMYSMIDSHRLEKATLSVALQNVKNAVVDIKKGPSVEIAGIANDNKILTHLVSSRHTSGGNVKLLNALFKKFRNVNFKKVNDACFYLFSKSALAILDKRIEAVNRDGGVLSLKKDFIPYMLKLQYMTPKHGDPIDVKCIVCEVPQNLYMKRINNVKTYFEANRDVSTGKGPDGDIYPKLVPKDFMPVPTKESSSMSPQNSSHMMNEKYETTLKDCVIGFGTEIENKCKIIGGILGNHVRIGKNTRIINSIIMNHVRIEKEYVHNTFFIH